MTKHPPLRVLFSLALAVLPAASFAETFCVNGILWDTKVGPNGEKENVKVGSCSDDNASRPSTEYVGSSGGMGSMMGMEAHNMSGATGKVTGVVTGKSDGEGSTRVAAGASDLAKVAADPGDRHGGDLTKDQALKLLQGQQHEILQAYAQPMGGKFQTIGENVIGDMRDWIQNSNRENFSSQRIKAQLALLDAQMALKLAQERTDIPEEQRQAEIDKARKRHDAAHQQIMALPKPEGSKGDGDPTDWGASPMNRVHSLFTKAYNEYVPPPPPPGQKAPPPVPARPGGGLPERSHIDAMLRDEPRNPVNWTLDAQSKLSAGDRSGGLDALNRSIALQPTADALGIRGGVYLNSGDYKAAYRDALEALRLNPGDKGLMVLLKSVEGRVPPETRAQIQAAVGGGSGPAFNRAAAAGAPARGGGASSASGFATFLGGATAREIPGMTTPQAMASSAKLDEARRALALGDLSGALSLAQRALELNPSNAAAHAFMASIYARTGDYRRAVASASAGLALAPRDSALLNTKAFSENRLKSYKDALASSNGAIESDPRGPWGYANRAYAYGGLGDKESMLHDINRAAQIDSRFEKAARDAQDLQLPSNADVLFLFPGEDAPAAAAPAASPKRRFGLVVAAGLAGGLLLALGLLSTVLAPVKDSVVSAFTKATRRGPSLRALEPATAEPVSVAGEVGGLIRGQYEIVRQIGVGGMGMVYEGNDKSLGRKVAIKKMRDELRVNARERERFVIEAKTVAALRHPHVVDIYAIAEDRDDVYLVFEYVEGKTIHDVVQAQGRLRPADAARVTKAIADALSYAHSRGVIHRDVKPSNVMVSPQGTIKVMDFGIARMAKDAMTRYSMTNTVVGTPPYMAPEQEQGVVRKESDVYALAVMSYEMLTGKLPFIGMGAGMLMNKINMSFVAPSRAIAGLPESLDEVFAKAFQADPDNRFRTPQEFSAALDAALGGARRTA